MLTDQWQGLHNIGDATYLVLRLDGKGEKIHVAASRQAASTYIVEVLRRVKGQDMPEVADNVINLRRLLAIMRKDERASKPRRERTN